MHSTSTCYVRGIYLVSVTQARRLLLSLYRHEAQTTLTLANIKFINSTPGEARNLYSYWGSEISFVWVLLCLTANFPQRGFKQSFTSPRLFALGLIASLSISAPFLALKVVT